MSFDLTSSLALAVPEVALAVGAMALLMIGVFSGERASTTVMGLAVALFLACFVALDSHAQRAEHSIAALGEDRDQSQLRRNVSIIDVR